MKNTTLKTPPFSKKQKKIRFNSVIILFFSEKYFLFMKFRSV